MSLKRQEGVRCPHQEGLTSCKSRDLGRQPGVGRRSMWRLGAYGHSPPVAFIFLGNQDTKPSTESEDGGGGCGGSERSRGGDGFLRRLERNLKGSTGVRPGSQGAPPAPASQA